MPIECVVLSAADVAELLSLDDAIASQRRAFEALANGVARLAPKVGVDGSDGSLALNYTARLAPEAGAVAKFVSVNPTNAGRGLPTINAVITVLDPATGQVAAIMDGTSVTTLRTAAASAVAADVLAPHGPVSLVVIGTGVQAAAHVRAIAAVRELTSITVVGRREQPTRALTAALSQELGKSVSPSLAAATAVPGADIVALCTTSSTPVLEHEWLREGTTLISVGSFTPERCEVQQATVRQAELVVVDDLPSSLEHAGPIMAAVKSGALQAVSIASIGDILIGSHPGRANASDLVFYNSVGVGVQDAAAAEVVLARAIAAGRGQRVRQ